MGRSLTYILLLSLALLTGCVSDDLSTDVLMDAKGKALGNSYITLTIYPSSRTSTRADGNNPTGGELGDGTEKGQDYENTVTSATLFLYQTTTGAGVNDTDGNTPVFLVEFDNMTPTTDDRPYDYIAVSEPQQTEIEDGTYRVLAIANPKDLTWARESTNLTLGDVRNHIETMAWTETDGNYSSFLMTSENDEKGSTIVLKGNPQDDPATTFVEVERTAVRVDYRTKDGNSYPIEEDGDNIKGTITITGATLVNNLTAGSYLLKRTNDGLGSTTVTYLGGETETNGVATNYVIDPWTDLKDGTTTSITIDGESDKAISDLYGVYYPGEATEEEQNPSFWENLMTKGEEVTDEETEETWLRIGYTLENTTYAPYTSKKYSTAIVFGATFTPADGTVVNSFFTDLEFTPGTSTLFKWNNTLYASTQDMMAAAYPNVFTTENMFGETTYTSITDMEKLAAFVATLRDDDPTGYKAYLESFTSFPTDKSSLYWNNYMEESIHYGVYETSGVVIDTDTRALLYAATNGAVSTYENSQCYYTWWIRHSNDDSDETNGVMEYSIVRNNIYKVEVESVQALGGDIPSEGLRIRVYVRNWTMLNELVIDL